MSDLLDDINTIVDQQWRKPTDVELVKAELVRRYGPDWELATMGFCRLQNGQEIYTALIADSPETTNHIFLQFITVEWDGSQYWIHETINTDGSDYQGE